MLRRKWLIGVLVVAISVLMVSPAFADVWSQWRGYPDTAGTDVRMWGVNEGGWGAPVTTWMWADVKIGGTWQPAYSNGDRFVQVADGEGAFFTLEFGEAGETYVVQEMKLSTASPPVFISGYAEVLEEVSWPGWPGPIYIIRWYETF